MTPKNNILELHGLDMIGIRILGCQWIEDDETDTWLCPVKAQRRARSDSLDLEQCHITTQSGGL